MESLTVAIPAYNESANIERLLDSIFKQKYKNFHIKEIIVISDGSTDNTVQIVKKMNNKLIRLMEFKKRMGKSYHINTLFNEADTDYLVFFDADVILKSNYVINRLIRPLVNNRKIGIVSGHYQPIAEKTFLQQAIESSVRVYETVKNSFKNGHNVLGCTGRIMALSKRCYKSLYVPSTMVLNDLYLYFAALKQGFEFRYVNNAVVYYQLATTFADYISQHKRSCVGHYRLKNIFTNLYDKEYSFNKSLLRNLMFTEFKKNPIHCIVLLFIHRVANYLSLNEINIMDGKWKMAKSTKLLVNVSQQ